MTEQKELPAREVSIFELFEIIFKKKYLVLTFVVLFLSIAAAFGTVRSSLYSAEVKVNKPLLESIVSLNQALLSESGVPILQYSQDGIFEKFNVNLTSSSVKAGFLGVAKERGYGDFFVELNPDPKSPHTIVSVQTSNKNNVVSLANEYIVYVVEYTRNEIHSEAQKSVERETKRLGSKIAAEGNAIAKKLSHQKKHLELALKTAAYLKKEGVSCSNVNINLNTNLIDSDFINGSSAPMFLLGQRTIKSLIRSTEESMKNIDNFEFADKVLLSNYYYFKDLTLPLDDLKPSRIISLAEFPDLASKVSNAALIFLGLVAGLVFGSSVAVFKEVLS